MVERDPTIAGKPFAVTVGSARGHVIANDSKLRPVNRAVCRTIGVNPGDATHSAA